MLSKFPGGTAGTGLLLLRLSVAGSLVAGYLTTAGPPSWRTYLTLVATIGLCAGFQTRLLCILVAAAAGHAASGGAMPWPAAFDLVNAIALALLGPGACSVDARLFGRRTVVLPAVRGTKV